MRRARRIKRWLPTTRRIARRARAPAHDGDDDDDDARERARFSASDADARAMRRASARESTREDARGRRTRNRRARIARRAETRERCARERDARGERRRRGWRRGRVLDVVDAREGGNRAMGDDGGGARARAGVGADVGETTRAGTKRAVERGERFRSVEE